MKQLSGAESPDAGTIKIGDTVQIGYVDQSRDALEADNSVWQEISGGQEELELGGRTIASRAYVSSLNFRGAANNATVPIRDTGLEGVDRLTANGTDFGDLFLLRKTQYFTQELHGFDSETPIGEQFDGFVASINRDGNLERLAGR